MINPLDLTFPRGAMFSPDRKYRYALWRVWHHKPLLLFIGLNPSTANGMTDDPTITRLIHRAAILGYGGLLAGNLYAYVSSNPDVLLTEQDTVGAENDNYLKQMIELSGDVLCGWGAFRPVKKRAGAVLAMIGKPLCLGVTRLGYPKHPLYCGYAVPLMDYKPTWSNLPPLPSDSGAR